jgi:hypothetical protein
MTVKPKTSMSLQTDGKNATSNTVIAGAIVTILTNFVSIDSNVVGALQTLITVFLIYTMPVFDLKMKLWQKKTIEK